MPPKKADNRICNPYRNLYSPVSKVDCFCGMYDNTVKLKFVFALISKINLGSGGGATNFLTESNHGESEGICKIDRETHRK